MPTEVRLPKDLSSFLSGASSADIGKVEDLINALQNLKVQVTITGTNKTVSTTVQISGDSAVINLQL